MELNEVKHGFKLINIQKLDDVGVVLYEYIHLKSKGKVAYLKNNDLNCCFAIGFKTLPNDSSGVCHIIEHSLLCGSKKYPLKDPFVHLIKSSLATFLNAFTADDWTMYPFASQTTKDFNNILQIYLDAVFNPLSMIDEKPFLQEGWHLELLNKEDLPSYKGVVYNEMKGAMSDADEILAQATSEIMYKDTPYRFNSGGDPEVIPTLSYQEYKDFYHKHYIPQNSLTILYGQLDIDEKLMYINQYFQHFEFDEKKELIIPIQKPHINLNYQKEYAISANEKSQNNTYISLCYNLCEYNDYETLLAFNILGDALLSQNDSPLKKALLDAQLGQNIEWRIDDGKIMCALNIYLQQTNPDKKEIFKTIFENEILNFVKNGLDHQLILSSINHLEFKDKELDIGGTPKGLLLAMSIMGSSNYNGQLSDHLIFTPHYEKFKKELDKGYFENLLEKYILNSQHHVEVVLIPSKTLQETKQKEMEIKMQQIKNSLSENQLNALIQKNNELIKFQSQVDSEEALNQMPSLNLSDIPLKTTTLPVQKFSMPNLHGITHLINNNGILYFKAYFNINKISAHDLVYVFILKSLFTNIPTKTSTISQLNNKIKTYLGDFSTAIVTTTTKTQKSKFLFRVSVSSLTENMNYIIPLFNEILTSSKFYKKETLTIIKQLRNDLKTQLCTNGMRNAMCMSKSAYSKEAAFITQCCNGYQTLEFLNQLIKNYHHRQVAKKLQQITKQLFNQKNLFVSISGDSCSLSHFKKEVKRISLYQEKSPAILKLKLNCKKNQAFIIPSSVSYNSLSSSLNVINKNFNGKHLVLSHIVSYDYLWNEIRVKGGAYGCSLSISKNNDVSFGTYRDPNVKISYEVIENISNYLKELDVDEIKFKNYIIGTVANFDTPLSTPSLINAYDLKYLSNFNEEDNLKLKKEVLSTTIQDIHQFANDFTLLFKDTCKISIGNKIKINELPNDFIVKEI